MKIYVHKIKKVILWVIFISSLVYIAYELHSLSALWQEIKKLPAKNIVIAFLLVFILMLGNWLFEAKKWQYLVKKVIPDYNLKLALQTVLCGITLGLFTPNRIGEYGARLFYIENEHKANLLILAFVDRFAQLWVTVLLGVFFSFVYVLHFVSEYMNIILFFCVLLLGFHISLLVLRNKIITFIVSRKLLRTYFITPVWLSTKDLGIVLGYAGLRYGIFVVQYLIWGYYTDNTYNVEQGTVAVNTMLFIKSVVPSAGLSELGIRESVLIYLYKSYGMSAFTAFYSALVVYAVNLLIPAVVGLFFMPQMAFWREKT